MPEYFTLEEFQALPECGLGTFTEAEVDAAEGFFVSILEREVGSPFVLRAETVTLDGSGSAALILPRADIAALSAVTVDGDVVDVGLLSSSSGILRYLTGGTVWPCGVGNIEVTYAYGAYATVPADVKSAVMWATRDRLLSQSNQNGIDVRRTSMTNDLGGTIQYVLPGEKRPTGYPELDALIASYQRNTPTFGFA